LTFSTFLPTILLMLLYNRGLQGSTKRCCRSEQVWLQINMAETNFVNFTSTFIYLTEPSLDWRTLELFNCQSIQRRNAQLASHSSSPWESILRLIMELITFRHKEEADIRNLECAWKCSSRPATGKWKVHLAWWFSCLPCTYQPLM
jgi:hypothetical protein